MGNENNTEQGNVIEELEAIEFKAADDEALEGDVFGTPKEPEPEIKTVDVLGPLLQITFGVIASRKGSHWNLAEQEANELGKAAGEVLDKYIPDFSVGCEITLLMTGLMIIGPRLAEDKRQAVERDKQDDSKQPGGDNAGKE